MIKTTLIFFVFLFTHLVLWTLAPVFFRSNLPLDAIEGTIWGQQLEWGYDKNPWLNGWLTALASTLDGHSGWMIYLFSQFSVVVCMWAVWKLANKMLPPVYALLAVLLLECIQYFNFHAIDFNDNTLELGLWAVTIYCFYLALHVNSASKWILTGLFAGLGLMAKYYTLALLAGMFLFLLVKQENRKLFKTFPPYAGLITFLLICLPHVCWLFSHDFITVKYVFLRGRSETADWMNHFIYPGEFFWQQIQVFLPAIIACTLLFSRWREIAAASSLRGQRPKQSIKISSLRAKRSNGLLRRFAPRNDEAALSCPRIQLNSFDKSFLFYVALAPFLLTLLLCFLFGIKLRAGWGMPLLSAWGIILIAIIKPNITRAKITGFIIFIFILLIAEVSAYSYSLLFPHASNTAIFPGKNIANALTKIWHDKYHTPLAYVGGSRWVGGNIGFYSKDHPSVYIELDKTRAPWIDLADLQKKGAIYVWEMSQWNDLPPDTRKKFEQFRNIQIMEFPWLRNHAKLPPVKIGVVILPPQKQ